MAGLPSGLWALTDPHVGCSLVEHMDIEERLRAASRKERDQAIVDAHNAGWSIRNIVAVVGYSVGRIQQIIKENTK